MYRFIFLFLLLYGCQAEPDTKATIALEKVGNIRIPLAKGIPTSTTCSKVYKVDGEEFLFLSNRNENKIVQINLHKPEEYFFHTFQESGPNGIGGLRGIAQIANNKMLIVSERPYHYHYDLKSKTVNSILLKESDTAEELRSADIASTFYQDFQKIANDHYFLQTGWTSMLNLAAEKPDYKLLAYYRPASESYHYAPFVFPKAYNAEKSYRGTPSMACDGKRCLISLMSDHLIHVYDGERQWTVAAKSQYAPDEMPQLSYDDPDFYNEYIVSEPIYRSMIYDPYRNLFYRVVQCHADADGKAIAKSMVQDYRFFPRQFSIIVLDGELNVVGETLLPPDKYNIKNIVVTQQGLAISAMHPKNSEMEEDFLDFDVFLPSAF